MGNTLVVDVSNFFFLVPMNPEMRERFLKSGGYLYMPPSPGNMWLICRLRARFGRIVFFAQGWDTKFFQIQLLRWLKKYGLLIPGQESEVVVFKTQAEKGMWCKKHHVDVFVSDQWRPTAEVFSHSPQTLCYFLAPQFVLRDNVLRLWDTAQGVLPQGRIAAGPTWDSFFEYFPA